MKLVYLHPWVVARNSEVACLRVLGVRGLSLERRGMVCIMFSVKMLMLEVAVMKTLPD